MIIRKSISKCNLAIQLALSICNFVYGQILAVNALKRLMNQSEERILQNDQSKNALMHL